MNKFEDCERIDVTNISNKFYRTRLSVYLSLFIVLMSLSTQALTLVHGPTATIVAANPDTPISGATIIVTGPQGLGFSVTTPEGHYIITQGLKAGTYDVSVLAEGYIVKNVGGVSVTVGVETKNIYFNLKRSGGVSGKVTDSVSGKPLVNITVTASSQNQFGYETLTDSEGNYKIITNLASGTYIISATSPTGYFSKTISGMSVTTGVETKEVNLALDRSGVISGKVTTLLDVYGLPTKDGQPLKGITVRAFSSDGKGFAGFANTVSDGTYTISTGLGTGKYTVTYAANVFVKSIQNVTVVAGQETSDVNLALNLPDQPPSGTIRGKVTDADNKPINGAPVTAGSAHDYTDANGDYEISGSLPTGTYTVEVKMKGYVPQNKTGVKVTEGSVTSNIDFEMPMIPPGQSGKISGTVTGEENPLGVPKTGNIKITVKDEKGKPIVGVSISSTGQPSGQSVLNGVSGADGVVSFSDLKPGSYTFWGSMTGYVSASGTGNVVANGSADVSITLQAKASGGGGSGGIPGYASGSVFVGVVVAVAFTLFNRRKLSRY